MLFLGFGPKLRIQSLKKSELFEKFLLVVNAILKKSAANDTTLVRPAEIVHAIHGWTPNRAPGSRASCNHYHYGLLQITAVQQYPVFD